MPNQVWTLTPGYKVNEKEMLVFIYQGNFQKSGAIRRRAPCNAYNSDGPFSAPRFNNLRGAERETGVGVSLARLRRCRRRRPFPLFPSPSFLLQCRERESSKFGSKELSETLSNKKTESRSLY